MYQSFPATRLPRQERFDYFAAVVDEVFCPMECRPEEPGSFNAQIEIADLGNLRIAHVSTSPVHVRRRRRDIARMSTAPYLIKFQLEGEAFWSQRGRDVHLRPGDFVIASTAEPYTLQFDGPYRMPVLGVSDSTMHRLTPDPDRFLGRRMPGEDASCGLLSSFVAQVVPRMSELPDPMAERVETNILDLLGGVLSAHGGSSAHFLPKTEQLAKIRGFIADNLRNRRLGPAMIAEALGVSTRYIHKLFAQESLTLTRYIRAQRTEACRRSLTDPAFRHLSITDIALYWGFYDLSHFTRSFREAYGTTPRQYRLLSRND